MGQHNMKLTDVDRCRLGTLLTCEEAASYGSARERANLETKLEEAEVVSAAATPRTLVTMNSTLVLVDASSGERKTCTLVYPEDRDLMPHSVGILQPLGQRLLGRCVGDIVRTNEGSRAKQFRIETIVYQPEAAGAGHL
jgi:regulator of nucleoside diphosphate kinase